MIRVSEAFRMSFPGAWLRVLAMTGIGNAPTSSLLEQRKAEIGGRAK